ncbi:MAG TPA: hypothetical protein VF171_00405 [Trueperaceae bacterium]
MTSAHSEARGGQGLRGHSGTLSGHELLHDLEKLACSGTLVLGPHPGPLVLLVTNGRVTSSTPLSGAVRLEARNQPFFFHPHAATDLPELASRYPTSTLGELRALPDLSASLEIPAALLDFRALVERLGRDNFHGCLTLTTPEARAVLALLEGRLATAFYEAEGQRRRGPDAVRGAVRLAANADDAQLALLPQPQAVMAALLGFTFEQRHAGDPNDFSGLELSGDGYRYYQDGQAYLQLRAEPRGTPGRYDLCRGFPTLDLPSEIPGWESQRYRLTLRGRDALNPMTELSMHFRSTYGQAGRRILEGLSTGITVEDAAHRLGIELAEIKPWVERLESEGMIRDVQAGR